MKIMHFLLTALLIEYINLCGGAMRQAVARPVAAARIQAFNTLRVSSNSPIAPRTFRTLTMQPKTPQSVTFTRTHRLMSTTTSQLPTVRHQLEDWQMQDIKEARQSFSRDLEPPASNLSAEQNKQRIEETDRYFAQRLNKELKSEMDLLGFNQDAYWNTHVINPRELEDRVKYLYLKSLFEKQIGADTSGSIRKFLKENNIEIYNRLAWSSGTFNLDPKVIEETETIKNAAKRIKKTIITLSPRVANYFRPIPENDLSTLLSILVNHVSNHPLPQETITERLKSSGSDAVKWFKNLYKKKNNPSTPKQ